MPRQQKMQTPEEDSGFIEKILHVNRVAKVVKGGRRFSFSTLVVVGDGEGHVGIGHGKANEVPEAIRKATEQARKSMFEVPLAGRTLPHVVIGHFGAGRVLIRPASPGTGVIAGPVVRAILDAAGVHDALTKSLGSNNPFNLSRAVDDALHQLESPKQYALRTSGDQEKVLENYQFKDRAAPAEPGPHG
jgi:small subunit ribosomal protein S5